MKFTSKKGITKSQLQCLKPLLSRKSGPQLIWFQGTGLTQPQPLEGKPIALISTAGRSGGEVSQITMKQALGSFNTRILQGGAFIVPFSDQAFDSNGKLLDPKQKESLISLMVRLRQEISLLRRRRND